MITGKSIGTILLTRGLSTSIALRNLEAPLTIPISKAPVNDGDFITVPHKEGSSPILLSKSNGQLYATSSTCPHYGAPLSKGVFSKDGRVTCPWHGAAFRTDTGEVCDGPSFSGLTSYQVTIQSDQVIITNKVPQPSTNPKKYQTSLKNPKDLKIGIVGGGAATMGAIQTLIDNQFPGIIEVNSSEDTLPIDRTKLSKMSKVSSDFNISSIYLKPEDYFKRNRVEFIGVGVDNAYPKGITNSSGKLRRDYDCVLVASGSLPKTNVPGSHLKNVFTLRKAKDLIKISQALNKPNPKLSIIGSGFIGMEVAASFSKNCSVTVISNEKVPFSNTLGPEIGGALQKLHESQNVKFLLNTGVIKITETEVVTSNGPIESDAVILGLGVAPQTYMIEKKYLDQNGRAKVNKYLKLEDFLYAAGDITSYPYHITEEYINVEHWNVAIQQGRVAAKNMLYDLGLSDQLETFTSMPYFWTSQFGKSLRLSGYNVGYSNVEIEGSLEKLEFIARYMKDDKVVAVASMNKDPAVSEFFDLSRHKHEFRHI